MTSCLLILFIFTFLFYLLFVLFTYCLILLLSLFTYYRVIFRYHHVVFLFPMDEEITTELPLTDEEMAEKFEGRKDKEFTGPIYEVISKVMKGLVGRKITVPGNFKG